MNAIAASPYAEPPLTLPVGRSLLGEGPAVIGGDLWWVDIDGRRVHRWNGVDVQTASLDRPASAVIEGADGSIAVTTPLGVERLVDGKLHPLVAIEASNRATRANDAKCDPDGQLYVGTMHVDAHAGQGSLYRIDDDGPTVVLEQLTISNGLGWSPDGSVMYHVDTATGTVDYINYRNGEMVGERKTLVPAGAASGEPDGLAVSSDGLIWVGRWGGSCVSVHEPRLGATVGIIEFPAHYVTSCCFGGPEGSTLYVTSAVQDDRLPGAGAVFVVETRSVGVPVSPWNLAGCAAGATGAST